MLHLNSDVEEIKGVGGSTKQLLRRLGIKTVHDLLLHTPFRYEDYSNVIAVKEIQPGPVTLKGRFKNIKSRRGRRGGLHITQAILDDGTGGVEVTWFNQPYRAKTLDTKQSYYLSGEYKFSSDRFAIINPSVEQATKFRKNTARIRGVYPETKGLRSATIRRLVFEALQQAHWDAEELPSELLEEFDLMQMDQAVRHIHFPKDIAHLDQAKKRFEFNEMFQLIMAATLLRRNLLSFKARPIEHNQRQLRTFTDQLDFSLTDAQRRVAWAAIQDLGSSEPMNRLVQGDVGSGKTVVAAMCADVVVRDGGQVAIVAPTEIVARQHLSSFANYLGVKPVLLTSSTPARTKTTIKNKLKAGTLPIVIGTHALLQPDIEFKKLDLLVIDEQHRFGVKQRSELAHKDRIVPHVLTMTATPIPRTLALTIYSDLDVSVIDEMPPGRKPVKTSVLGPGERRYAYEQLAGQLEAGHQAYVVCPLIDESDKLGVTSVAQEYRKIVKAFPERSVAQLHGSLKPQEKEDIIEAFNAGEVDILVSTTVVEVGVNVANATFMLIEGAERFGLAQLHQLRGRVGRAGDQAYCMAMTTRQNQAQERLQAFGSTTDGFVLAELDLQLRGGGELLGTSQSGDISFQYAQLSNTRLVAVAKQAVKQFLNDYDLLQYPRLQKQVEQYKSIKRLN